MILKELFNKPPKIEYNFQPHDGLFRASFKTKTQRYVMDITSSWTWEDEKSEYVMSYFNLTDEEHENFFEGGSDCAVYVKFEDPDGSSSITGVGNSIQVFSAVYNILEKYFKKYKPVAFLYQAEEPNRQSLYKKLFERFSGYQSPILINKREKMFCCLRKDFTPNTKNTNKNTKNTKTK